MMWMTDRSGWWTVIGATAVCGMWMLAGCQGPSSRLNAPPQGPSERPNKLQDQYTYMNDNALLAEMSMSPAHFIPGRADLNGLGLRRLTRYAELLQQYSGTLHYDGVQDPEPLARERMERMRGFLAQAGLDPKCAQVELGLAGGTGMRGEEAIEIRQASDFTAENAKAQSKGGKWESGATSGGGQ
jgi:hypothetical protein